MYVIQQARKSYSKVKGYKRISVTELKGNATNVMFGFT